MTPTVSVVTSVFNGEHHLREAIQSILNQTYADFELLIVNDGSTDRTAEIIAGYAEPRIRVLENRENVGLTRSLNRALKQARGELVARQDADDISLSHRLECQTGFLAAHPEVGILGSSYTQIDDAGTACGSFQAPTSDSHIRWRSLLTNPFAHPTVMFRRSLLNSYESSYDETLWATQDYDLWARLLGSTRGANVAESLVLYRRAGNITTRHRALQLKNQDQVAYKNIRQQLHDFSTTSSEVSKLRSLFVGGDSVPPTSERVRLGHQYLNLFHAFRQQIDGKETEWEKIGRQEASKVALVCLRSAMRTDWLRLMRRCFALHRGLLWQLSKSLISSTLSLPDRRVV